MSLFGQNNTLNQDSCLRHILLSGVHSFFYSIAVSTSLQRLLWVYSHPQSPFIMSSHVADLPATMKAMQFVSVDGGIERHLKLNAAAIPPSNKLSPKEVCVEVISMSVNAFDYKLPETPLIGGVIVKRPSSPGVDFCGRVVSATSDSGLKQGQIVFGKLDAPTKFGTLGQYVIAPLAGVVPVPPGVDLDDAAAVGLAGLTAYQSIVPNIESGDKVFINGGSGGTYEPDTQASAGSLLMASCAQLEANMLEP